MLTQEKGYFALHDDPLSNLLYDVQFWLYTRKHPVESANAYFDAYPTMIAFGDEFSTRGYAPDFVVDWYNDRFNQGFISKTGMGLQFTPAYTAALLEELNRYH